MHDLQLKREQLQIDREVVRIARDRLEFDKAEAVSEKRFWKMGAGTRVTILVSAAAVVVSLVVGVSTVWASWIAKEKEIQVSAIQHKVAQEKLDAQKKREWDLALAQFVLSNKEAIYNGTPQERQVLAKIIPTIFPQDVSVALLERLEKTTPLPERAIWTKAKSRVGDSNLVETKETSSDATKVAVSKPSQAGLTNLATVPSWFSTNPDNSYGYLSLDKINSGIGGSSRDAFNSSLNSPSPVPNLLDIAYRPPSSAGIGNASDIFKSLNLTSSVTLTDGLVIVGRIVDATTGTAVPRATIEFQSQYSLSRVHATADDSGNFSIIIPLGSYLSFGPIQLKIGGDGYKSATREVKNAPVGTIPMTLGDVALEKGTQP